ncbi:MAG: serpin family protein [Candidatus Eremiobacteraeota bacterium]|nr:serpin family protein [Candidatus Eremiobacteraeota bacterium]
MKKAALTVTAGILLFLLAWVPCGAMTQDGACQGSEADLASRYSGFGFNLYPEVLKAEKGKNVFISPASIAIALAMTYNGAARETQSEMADVLGLKGLGIDKVNEENRKLLDDLRKADPSVTLEIANSLWARKGLTLKPEFVKRNKEFFGAEVSNELVASAINAWVSKSTKGKITSIIDRIENDVILILVNAIYFKGTWTAKFDKALTKPMDFATARGAKKVPMMMQKGKYLYYSDRAFQAVALPYGNKRFFMYVFLPSEQSTLGEFHGALTFENWSEWTHSLKSAQGTLFIPRFKCEYSTALNDSLKALGMKKAFGANADFSEMVSGKAFISKVIHKTFVEVNEEGTEAAAVTAVLVARGAPMGEEKPFVFKADRPFFFAIVDRKTQMPLFMGSIVNP